jgi:hypothetical protein
VVQAVQEKSPEAGKYFEAVSRVTVDPKRADSFAPLSNVSVL